MAGNARRKKLNIFILFVLICLSSDNAFAMPDQTEIAIGREIDARLKKKNGVCENSDVQKYIEHVGLKIVSVSERQDMVYHFTVLDSDAINAIAAPGGYVYLTKGLLVRMENEAQLAAALAHQIVHVARRHGIKQIEEDMRLKTVIGKPTYRAGLHTARYFLEFGFGKKVETDADLKATQYLLWAGYDPQAMIKFLDIIQIGRRQHPRLVAGILRSHPKATKRIDMARAMCDALRRQDQKMYESTAGNYYPERYKENVLDALLR